MAALAVGEDLEVLEERGAGLEVGPKGLPGEELALQGGEEAFGHGIVVAIANGTHGAADADRLAAFAEEQRRVLSAMVGVVNHAALWSAVPDRHLQGANPQFRSEVIRHGPPHHAAAEHVEDHREVEKAFPCCWDLGDVGDPELVRRAGGEGALAAKVRWTRSGAGSAAGSRRVVWNGRRR